MPSDFTVIQAVRQRFGNPQAPDGESQVFSNAPYAGPSKEYSFDCPGVDPNPMAVLQFATIGVDVPLQGDMEGEWPESILRVNGVDIPGGFQPGEDGRREWDTYYPTWKTQIMLVPERTLRDSNNVLYIEVPALPFFNYEVRDAFVIDNIVLFYKTGAPLDDHQAKG